MKLAVITERYHPAGGGAERSTHQIVSELAQRGHAVTVLAGSAPDDAAPPGVALKALASRPNSGVAQLVRFHRFVLAALDADGYDASLSVTMSAPATVVQPRSGCLPEVQARNVARKRSSGARLLKRAALAASPKQWALGWLERRTVADPRVRRFAAVSRYVAGQLQQHHGVGEDQIEVLPNAAAMPVLDAAMRATARRELRLAHGLGEDDYVLLFAALNASLKGLDPLLAALKRTREQGVAATLWIAGTTRYRDLRTVAESGVREHVRMLGSTDRMAEVYAAADVTVLPTFFDPASKVVIESLMLGVPAISTRHNGASDFIVDGAGGPAGRVIDDPWDTAALAEAIRELADGDERARCAAAAAGLGDRLTMTRHVDRLEAMLDELAG